MNRLNELVHMVEQGEMKASKAFAEIYEIEKTLKQAKDAVKDAAIQELSDYAKGDEPVVNGYRMKIIQTSRHSFKHDAGWQRFSDMIKSREDMMKKAHNYKLKHGADLIDDNGEIVPPSEINTTTAIKMERSR